MDMRWRRLLIPALLVAISGLMACGGDDGDVVEAGQDPTSTTASTADATTTTTPATTTTTNGEDIVSGEISLTVQVAVEGQIVREGSLSCDAARTAGTGFLEEAAAAQAACDLLTGNPGAVNLLAEGRQPGMMCTQQYGGPEVAKVTGTIGDRRIHAMINRTDGCGIAEWNLLQALLGPPNA